MLNADTLINRQWAGRWNFANPTYPKHPLTTCTLTPQTTTWGLTTPGTLPNSHYHDKPRAFIISSLGTLLTTSHSYLAKRKANASTHKIHSTWDAPCAPCHTDQVTACSMAVDWATMIFRSHIWPLWVGVISNHCQPRGGRATIVDTSGLSWADALKAPVAQAHTL